MITTATEIAIGKRRAKIMTKRIKVFLSPRPHPIHICCIPVELCQIIAFLFAFFLHHLCGGVGMDRAMKDEGRRLSLSFIAFFPSPTESATSHRRSRSR